MSLAELNLYLDNFDWSEKDQLIRTKSCPLFEHQIQFNKIPNSSD